MADIITQLQVLSRDRGCLLDISAILDLSICPRIDIRTDRPHKVEQKDEYVYVTPTENSHYRRDCQSGACYEVTDQVCQKNTAAFDIELLVLLGLLSKEDLEKYLRTCGKLGEHDTINPEKDDVGVDPLLGLDIGKDGGLLDLDVGGDGGLLNLDVGKKGDGKEPLANLNIGGEDGLLSLDVGGKKDGLLNLHLRRSNPNRLLDIDVGGKKDKDEAAIDVDVLTHSRRADKGLLDVDVGGEKDDDESTIDLDILTHGKNNAANKGGKGNGRGNGNGGNGNGSNGGNKNRDQYLSHYQPICKKAFKPEHRDRASTHHAADVNHCLAICHQESALVTLRADVKVGDVAKILVCAAIEFDQHAQDNNNNNCRYIIAPENEPCEDDYLEHNENCYTFVRN
ncbi:Fc.00g024180.m01.CDS01 [Cosmosporella sp. VM-42]